MNRLKFSNADCSLEIAQDGYDFTVKAGSWKFEVYSLKEHATISVKDQDGYWAEIEDFNLADHILPSETRNAKACALGKARWNSKEEAQHELDVAINPKRAAKGESPLYPYECSIKDDRGNSHFHVSKSR